MNKKPVEMLIDNYQDSISTWAYYSNMSKVGITKYAKNRMLSDRAKLLEHVNKLYNELSDAKNRLCAVGLLVDSFRDRHTADDDVSEMLNKIIAAVYR